MLNTFRRPLVSVTHSCRRSTRQTLLSFRGPPKGRTLATRAGMVHDIQPTEAANLIKDAVYLDVRTVQEFEAERVEGAVNVPFMHRGETGLVPNAKFAEDAQAALPDKKAKIVVGCQVGGRSSKASAALEQLGFEDVSNVLGGLNAWKADKLPLQKLS